jgi:hypothetical protein
MGRSRKIVVAGFIVGFPLGGQVWAMIHFLLGLSRLGHEVLFLEDTSDWSYPFDPDSGYGLDSSFGRRTIESIFARHAINGRWAYNSILEDKLYGVTRKELDRFCSDADLLLNVSAVTPLRENYMRCRKKAVIDTDPVFTQARIVEDQNLAVYYKAHDACFTYGWNLPEGKTRVPLSGLNWRPTLPPVVLEEWVGPDAPGGAYTTIGSWDTKDRDIVLDGERLSWRKSVRYESLIALPGLVPGARLELTFSGMGEEDGPRFERHGWSVRDAIALSRDLEAYRNYIRSSRAEFTVAKDQNVRLKSGWFSDRSACYLAAGRPVITEDTGFDAYLPVGEGLFAFQSLEEAVRAIEAVEADPVRHGAAAHRIAREYFDAEKVLGEILAELDLA